MARLNFTAGVAPTVGDFNELARQVVSDVTMATVPASPSEGEIIAVTDRDRYYAWNGAAWRSMWPWSVDGRPHVHYRAGVHSDAVGQNYRVWWDTPISDPLTMWRASESVFHPFEVAFMIPVGYGGVWAVNVVGYTSDLVSSESYIYALTTGGTGGFYGEFTGIIPAGRQRGSLNFVVPLIELSQFAITTTINHSAAIERGFDLFAVRLTA